MAIKGNLVIDQGTDFSALIEVDQPDGQDFPLSGYTVAAQMRKNYASSTAYDFTATISVGNAEIEIKMANTLTSIIEPGRYLYDVEITSPAGEVTRVVEGIVTVTPGITRTT